MSKLSRTSLAFLATLAMLLVWSGTATADDPPLQTYEECLAGLAPETCIPPDLPLGGGSAGGEQEGTGAGDGESSGAEGGGEGGADSGDTVGETGGGEPAGGKAEQSSPVGQLDLPDCETPADLPDCLPDCEDELFAELPVCEDEPPTLEPCESVEDLPLCIPDCEFIAELLGQEGCEVPDCLDTTQLPAQVVEIIEHLPEEIRAELPFCEVEEPPGENPGGEQPPPGGTPVGGHEVTYDDCDDARAQGAAPVHEGEPGYGPHLDSDDDGIGCEDDTVVPVVHTTGGQLAYTGAELGPQVKLGGVLLLLGGGFLLAGRRRA